MSAVMVCVRSTDVAVGPPAAARLRTSRKSYNEPTCARKDGGVRLASALPRPVVVVPIEIYTRSAAAASVILSSLYNIIYDLILLSSSSIHDYFTYLYIFNLILLLLSLYI